jgi:hypothetical protein
MRVVGYYEIGEWAVRLFGSFDASLFLGSTVREI